MPRHFPDPLLGTVESRKDGTRLSHQECPSHCQLHAADAAVEERHPQAFLETTDGRRQRWLADGERLRSAPHRAGVCNRHNLPQNAMIELSHAIDVSYRIL